MQVNDHAAAKGSKQNSFQNICVIWWTLALIVLLFELLYQGKDAFNIAFSIHGSSKTQQKRDLNNNQQTNNQLFTKIPNTVMKQQREKSTRLLSTNKSAIALDYLNDSVIFLTGIVGFIGFHTTKTIFENENLQNITIIGFDNFDGNNPYYPGALKYERLKILESIILKRNNKLEIINGNLDNRTEIENALKRAIKPEMKFTHILHLAAQAGVRFSAQNPYIYVKSNVNGFINLIEYIARNNPTIPIVYASSSSVYGMSKNSQTDVNLDDIQINSENDLGIMPESVYAATKKSDELLSWTYHKIYKMNFIGLRFFTVYGTYGRPDMAYMIFAKNIFQDKAINLYNNGIMKRDFTHVSDIVNGILKSLNYIKYETKENRNQVWQVINLGNGHPRSVMDLVNILKNSFKNQNYDKINKVNNKPNGDVFTTYANVTKAHLLLGYEPQISLEDGIKEFAQWFEKDKNDPNSQFVKIYMNMM